MNDTDFAREAAVLVSRCSPAQRKTLVDFVTNYRVEGENSATEQASDRRPLAADASITGKPISEAFPGLKRLHGAA